MKLIDAHFHLDFYRDHQSWYSQINAMKQYTLCVTNSPEIYLSCKKLYPETRYVKFALGYNPQISTSTPLNKQLFLSQLASTKYIGEVGLDYSAKNVSSKRIQVDAFDFICHNAAKYNKVLSVHSRKAEKDTLDILTRNKVQRAIIHWYTGDLETLQLFIQEGFYFSVNTNMCATAKGRSIIRQIPLERILVESDGPFTKVGTQKFTPVNLHQVYSLLSTATGIPHFDKLVYDNFNSLLRMDESGK